ncbi:MAG TPA: polysaccharide biosynthesis/export family protein [Rhizomicrobium sp.]|nr:polysaccharide biosynthesis/export family protein [Rhizomicrobium sp.]
MRLVTLLLVLVLGGCSTWESISPWSSPKPPPAVSDYLLRPGDALQITVAGESELNGLYPVKSDGTIWFQMLGAVPAAGFVVPVFQESLRQRLAAGYLKSPQVAVMRVAAPPPPVLRPSQ